MKIVCPKCGQNYEVDKTQINAETNLECSVCNTVFPFTPKPHFSSLWYMLKIIAIVVIGTIAVLSCTVGYLMWQSNKVSAELARNTEKASIAYKEAAKKLEEGDKLRSGKNMNNQMKEAAIAEITKVINAKKEELNALNKEARNNTENFQLGWNPSVLYNIITAFAFFVVIIGFVFLYYKKWNML